MNPAWGKGYLRRGAALHGLHRYDDAVTAYEEGIKQEDSPGLQKGLREVQEAKGSLLSLGVIFPPPDASVSESAEAEQAGTGIAKIFQDPNLFSKLAANPKTAPLLADHSFVQTVCRDRSGMHVSLLMNSPSA